MNSKIEYGLNPRKNFLERHLPTLITGTFVLGLGGTMLVNALDLNSLKTNREELEYRVFHLADKFLGDNNGSFSSSERRELVRYLGFCPECSESELQRYDFSNMELKRALEKLEENYK